MPDPTTKLGIAILALSIGVAACVTDDKITIEEIENALHEGMTREEVESFFTERGIGYSFTSRDEADRYTVPRFLWKSADDVGYYGAVIPDVRFRWRMLASEHIRIRVEIDSQDRVSQVIVSHSYTSL